MYLSLLLAAVQAEVPEAPTPDLLAPNAGLVFWTAVTFGIVLFLLWRYAWGPIARALEEREDNISSSIQRAEKALAEAKQVQADNQKARREAEREARDSAEALREEEVEKTRAKIRQMQEQAQAEIEREKQGALEELREEVADLAIQAASKILKEDLDQDRQRRLVDDFIDDLPTN